MVRRRAPVRDNGHLSIVGYGYPYGRPMTPAGDICYIHMPRTRPLRAPTLLYLGRHYKSYLPTYLPILLLIGITDPDQLAN